MTMLVVEEAQHLTPVVLEEIRLLTNLETARGKLLQILLVGQPELATILDAPNLRQLKQRVVLWFRLRLLSEQETSDYVQFRLKLAGDRKGQIFTPTTLERIYLYSQGTPRLINTLCDNAMMSAFALRKSQVTPELVEETAADLGLKGASANGHSMASGVRWPVGGEASELEAGNFAAVLEVGDRETDGYSELDSSAKEESE